MLGIQDHVRVWQLALMIGVASAACTTPADGDRAASNPVWYERSNAGGAGASNGLGLPPAAGALAPGAAAAGFAAGTAGGTATQRRWPKAAITSPRAGSVTGKVFDAVSGNPIPGGSVVTNSKCVGCDPTRSPMASIKDGAFVFPAALQSLTLDPSSTFTLIVQGYESVTVAHGPWGAVAAGGQMSTEIPPIYLCPNGAKHGDRDRICDAAEMRYGTNPSREDTDGDALSDAAELYGVDGDEVLDIRGLGVDPLRADVLLELDFMKGLAPSQAAVDAVVAAFNRAPPKSTLAPNKPGIALHAWVDDEVDASSDIDVPSFSRAKPIIKSFFNLQSKWPTHYGLFARQLVESKTGAALANSGVSMSIAGTVFFVTLPALPTAPNKPIDASLVTSYQAASLMHQLGHNLGLQHGGGEEKNFKPNYLSVMNSLYQFDAVPKAFNPYQSPISLLDYSRFATPELVENKLSEQKGLDAMWPPGVMATMPLSNPWSCGSFDPKTAACMTWRAMLGGVPGSLDFNGDGKISATTIAQDLNGNGTTTDVFRGASNDWETLDFNGKPSDAIVQSGAAVIDVCPAPPDGLGGVHLAADGGVPDGSAADAGAKDGGTSDAGAADGGGKDAGAADGGSKDAGAADGGMKDAGVLDSGVVGSTSILDSGIATSAPRTVTSSLPPVRPPVSPTTSTLPRTSTPARTTPATTPTAGRGGAGSAGKASAGTGGVSAKAGTGGSPATARAAGSGGSAGAAGSAGARAGSGGAGGTGGNAGRGGAGGADAGIGDAGVPDASDDDDDDDDPADAAIARDSGWGDDPWDTTGTPASTTNTSSSEPGDTSDEDDDSSDPGGSDPGGWSDPSGWSDPGGGDEPDWSDPGGGADPGSDGEEEGE